MPMVDTDPIRFNIEGSEEIMEFVVVHLELKDDPEEIVHVGRVSVNNDVMNALLLDLSENHPIVLRIGLPDVQLQVLHRGSPDQILEPDQTKLILIENGSLGPVQELHEILVCLVHQFL